MTALSTPKNIHTQLSTYATAANPVPHDALGPILHQLAALDTDLQTLDNAIQTTADVNGALTLVIQMMEAAYDRKLDADCLRCLLEPLREKLGKAVDEMRWVL
ncbi:MAG: hypothetical protein ACRYF9_06740 [Janthinobacterium lividum]